MPHYGPSVQVGRLFSSLRVEERIEAAKASWHWNVHDANVERCDMIHVSCVLSLNAMTWSQMILAKPTVERLALVRQYFGIPPGVVLCTFLGPLLKCSLVQSVRSVFFPWLSRTWTRWWSSWNPCRWNVTRCWMTPRHQSVLIPINSRSLWSWSHMARVLWGCDRSSFLRLTRETSWNWDGQGKGGY